MSAVMLAIGVSPTRAAEGDPEVTTTTSIAEPDDSATTTSSTATTLDEGEGDPEPTTTSTSAPATTTTAEPVVTTRPPTPTPPTSEVSPLIVAGPPDGRRQITPEVDAAVDTVTSVAPVAPAPAEDDAERVIRLVVLGLIAVAVLLAALAVYYWWITRPPPLASEDGVEASDPTPTPAAADDTVDPWLTDSTSTR